MEQIDPSHNQRFLAGQVESDAAAWFQKRRQHGF